LAGRAANAYNPHMLTRRPILLGVTGGIAAYKAVELLRLLKKDGAEVTVVMTENAKRFVGPATFQALSGRPVADDLWAWRPGMPIEHLALAQATELAVVAPATANTLARMAAGIADDLLGTLLLAVTAPVLVAPAMNTRMILHPATQANLATLVARGVHVVPAESGELAAEEAGYGRLAAVETIHARVRDLLLGTRDLAGRRVLVTAGPTREPLDPVRYLSNRSSGKMGFALAAAAHSRGAAVTLVAGPVALPCPAGVDLVPVLTAEQMRQAVLAHLDGADAVVMAAAVADYRPGAPSAVKIKKGGRGRLVLDLEPTVDILAELGARRGPQVLVGFAAETGDPAAAAQRKLAEKNLDLVVANNVTLAGAGFDVDTNQVELFTRDDRHIAVPLATKLQVAGRILDEVVALLARRDRR
jgi:phosphopantothenoylcysteine decarboxylase/phosphopantothenate--cysteine ligase